MSDVDKLENNKQQSVLQELIPSKKMRWTAYWSVWIFLGFASAIHWYYLFPGDHSYTWFPLVRNKLGFWCLWGSITLFIVWLSGKLPIKRSDWFLQSLKLFSSGIVIVGIYLTLWAGWVYVVSGSENPATSYRYMLRYAIGFHSTFYFLAFCATVVAQQFYRVIKEQHMRELATSELKSELTSLHLDRLRSQLQPHFLFNALNTISSQVTRGQPNEAHETLTDLADLLRISLERSTDRFVSLAAELQLVQRYMKVMTARFPDRIKFEQKINPETLNASVPSLLLQPLIENAIKYGVDESSAAGAISIESEIVDGNLSIAVSNIVAPDTNAGAFGTGIGLSNTRERLFHLYGEKGILRIAKEEKDKLVVTVTIPFQVDSAE